MFDDIQLNKRFMFASGFMVASQANITTAILMYATPLFMLGIISTFIFIYMENICGSCCNYECCNVGLSIHTYDAKN